MSEEIQDEPQAFPEYETSIGTVIAHDCGSYIVRLFDGRVVGIAATAEPSAAAFEQDAAQFKVANGL